MIKGDKVKVVCEYGKIGGIDWDRYLEDTIGNIYEIENFSYRDRTCLLDNGYWYHFESLKKVSE